MSFGLSGKLVSFIERQIGGVKLKIWESEFLVESK